MIFGLRKWCFGVALGLLFAMPVEARTCFLWQINGANFGNYFPMQAGPLDTNGQVRVLCWGRRNPGQGNSYTVRISGVTDATQFGRRMNSGTDQLPYNLFKDAARTDVWGDGTFGMTPLVQRVTGRFFFFRTHQVYGRVPPMLDPAPGVYNDVVDVTIEF